MLKLKYRNRLLKLADFLEKLPPEKFWYEAWVGKDWKGKQNLSCGTTACAMGWAATIPSFRKLGLFLAHDKNAWYATEQYFVAIKDRRGGWKGNFSRREIDKQLNPSYIAGNEIFGLEAEEFERLFVPGTNANKLRGDVTAKEVAEEIRRFVAEQATVVAVADNSEMGY